MANRDFRDRLRKRVALAGIDLATELEAPLEAYYRLLEKWNSKINLTAFKLTLAGDDASIDRLIVEPLAALRHIPRSARNWLDAGSGGGSPAIPIKLAEPSLQLHMVEAKTRKAAFLREAVRELGLEKANVETSRFELLLTKPELHESVDLITIRAVRLDLQTLITLQAFLKKGGRFLQFRGSGRVELESATARMELLETHPLLRSNGSNLAVFRKLRT